MDLYKESGYDGNHHILVNIKSKQIFKYKYDKVTRCGGVFVGNQYEG